MAAFFARHPLAAVWAAWAVVLAIAAAPAMLAFATQDPDDYLRLLQVRDLLAGQGWFDVRQYRMDPPAGAEMHWSRLVDLPLAVALAGFRLLLAELAACVATMTVLPLLQLLLAMVLTARLCAELGTSPRVGVIAAAVVPLFPVLSSTFLPLRIDHHGSQAIAALACGLMLVRTPSRRAAALAGLLAAAWLAISLEGLPLVTMLAAIYGLRYVQWRDPSLPVFLAGLAAASAALFVAGRAPGAYAAVHCDALSWPHLAGLAAAAAATAAATGVRQPATRSARGAALAIIACVVAPLVAMPLGACATDPFATLDPIMRTYWHDQVSEGLPITRQAVSVQAMLLWTPLVVAVGWQVHRTSGRSEEERRRATMLALYALAAAAVSFLLMRGAVNAQIVAVPFAAVTIERGWHRARALRGSVARALATAALPVLVTPAAASAAGKALDPVFPPAAVRRIEPFSTAKARCDLRRLARLPPAHLFATMDIGPEILVRTGHTVVTSGYHRNMARMREVVEAFSGDPQRAEAIVRLHRTGYVVLCLATGEAAVFRSRRPDNLANRLAGGRPPGWLTPQPGFARGSLRVYRVRWAVRPGRT